MKQWVFSLCALTVVASSIAQQYQQFVNRYDNFNADSIIQNDRILLAYYKCVMEKGPCTKDGKNFKRVLPETLQTACGRCSSKQKVVVRKMLLGIKAKSEPRFLELLEKYDPTQANREALYNFLVTGTAHLLFYSCDLKLKMKVIILALCIIALAFAEDKYDSSSDDIDLSEVLGNDRLIAAYSKCLLDKGACTPEVKKLKEKLPEVLETRCGKCTNKQKQIGKQLISEIKTKHPETWSQLAAFYDPQGKYKQSLEEFLKS
ncbi:uncharacterized protein LOC112049024 [Bicyclus anynana]|uniref:Uncharacterized protein LOC112049024 n=1 Tax=Bicyclus anynana TaxID=110368 RepID=A0A6J1NBY8_BICAN|nr:uncharacterized protein LOC112049024 [Bicyclus anynana]